MTYTSREVAVLYNVSKGTVRNWAVEFAEYLSPTATPEANKNRMYAVSDLEVFALVAELKKHRRTYEDIHFALKSGQRGKAPELPPEQMGIIAYSEQDRRLTLEIEHLKFNIVRLQEELNLAKSQAEQAQQYKEEKISLQAHLSAIQSQLVQTQERLENVLTRNEELATQAGREYAKGYTDALKEWGELPKKE